MPSVQAVTSLISTSPGKLTHESFPSHEASLLGLPDVSSASRLLGKLPSSNLQKSGVLAALYFVSEISQHFRYLLTRY